MCGIAGAIGVYDSADLAVMAERLHHRGPDGRGVAEQGPIGLVSTRLSLLDDAHGAQPWRDETMALVFNGEIYNHRELREMLAGPYRSHCDTETLAHGWRRWGPDLWRRLDGMFTVAIAEGDTLVLARDPHGQKPLFLWRDPMARALCFASEMHALLADGRIQRRFDEQALVELGALGFPLDDDAVLEGIAALPPGHELTIRVHADGSLESSLRDYRHDQGSLARIDAATAIEPVDALVAALPKVVQSHAYADHPVGVLLSGGLDSGILAALLVETSSAPVHTFTLGDHADHPDVVAARKLAMLLGTEHHEYIVDVEEVEAAWPAAVLTQGSPALPSIAELGSSRARAFVKAIVVGDGADELFGGYRVHRTPKQMLGSMGAGYNNLVRARVVPNDGAERIRRCFKTLSAMRDPSKAIYRFFLEQRLVVNHLRRWDHGSMAHGLEVRLPYLARPITAIAERFDIAALTNHPRGKAPLREAARRLLPPEAYNIIEPREKVGAPSALARTRAVLNERAKTWLSPDYVERHPLRAFAYETVRLVSLDLFALHYLSDALDNQPQVQVAELYRDHGETLDALWAGLRARHAQLSADTPRSHHDHSASQKL